MKLLDLGREGLNIFAEFMDISQGINISTYDLIVRHIHIAASSMFECVQESRRKRKRKLCKKMEDLKQNLKYLAMDHGRNADFHCYEV